MMTRSGRLVGWIGAVCAAVMVLAGTATVLAWMGQETSQGPRDMRGHPVHAEVMAAPSAVAQMRVSPTGLRFKASTVGLDVPLLSMGAPGGVINPPGFTSVYQVRGYGVDVDHATTGTVYLATHSLANGGKSPGNALTDIKTSTSLLAAGDVLQAGGRTWRVTGWQLVGKAELPHATWVWQSDPGRLVVITCMERPDGRASTQNLIITAALS
ncbi:MAG: class F sortase [Pseudoclavibacter sp.]